MPAPEQILVNGFNEFGGDHCESSALRKVFAFHGLDISEEMLFGIGGGPGFIYWKMKMMPLPFVGTRNKKVRELLADACSRLGGHISTWQSGSRARAHAELKKMLRAGEPVICYGDMVFFPYFCLPDMAHFGGHAFVVYGIDEVADRVLISDRCQRPVWVTVAELQAARDSQFPPFAPKNALLKLAIPKQPMPLDKAIRSGIRDCVQAMLHPPIKNFGLAGMTKWADLVLKWPEQYTCLGTLLNTFIYIEIGGTGGSGFRLMYSRFLNEAARTLNRPAFSEAAELFRASAIAWSRVARAALPDEYPELAAIRKNVLTKSKMAMRDSMATMKERGAVNAKMLAHIRRNPLNPAQNRELHARLRDEILNCRRHEEKAFTALKRSVQ